MQLILWERHCKKLLIKYKNILFLTLVTIIVGLIKASVSNFTSLDYLNYLHPWFVSIRHLRGINALRYQVGDYNILYQLLIALLTYLPIKDLYLYKTLSMIFDFLLAISAGWLVTGLVPPSKVVRQKYFMFTYAVVLCLPTVILNSSVWAQCDSIYTTFIVLALAFLVRKKYICSFAMLGVAIAFKLQAVFILPFFLLVWLVNNRVYVYHFLIMVFTFWLSGLPGYVYGRSLLASFRIYLNQTHTYNYPFMNYYNFSGLLDEHAQTIATYNLLGKVFILGTLLILIIGYMYLLSCYSKLQGFWLVGVAIWTVYTCVMFLPAMHERYAFVVDILMVVIAILNKKYDLVAIPEVLNSLLSYNRYLFASTANIVAFSYIAVTVYIVFTLLLFYDFHKMGGTTLKVEERNN